MTVEKLMELDMAFCETTSKLGAQGWANQFKKDGIMLSKTGDNIVNEEEIYKHMKPFFSQKGASLIWSPENGGISNEGDLGYTFGKYIRTYRNNEDKTVQETGRYITVWRKVASGKYLIEIDMGN